MTDYDEPSCPASVPIGDGAETVDLMCWLKDGHAGPHVSVQSPSHGEVLWQLKPAPEARDAVGT